MLSKILFAAGAFAATALAQNTATVTIQTSHGGADSDLTNTTITVPLNTTYTNPALDEVSNLLLTGASGVALDSITCTGHFYPNGTGHAGNSFTSSQGAYLSTNDVQVGSITCVSSGADANASTSSMTVLIAPTSTTVNGTALSTTATLSATSGSSTVSTVSDATSTFLTTVPAAAPTGDTAQQSTVTSVMVASGSDSSPTSTAEALVATESASSTSSSSASLSSGNAAGKLSLSEAVWPGLALGALGLAMAA